MRDGYSSIATFANPVEAELARGRLQASGIQAELTNASAASSMYGAGNPITDQVLYVEVGRIREALALLAETDVESNDPALEGESSESPAYDGFYQSDWNRRERAAETAYRASIVGWLVPGVSWYALWKLAEVVFSDLPLSGKPRGHAIVAGVAALLPALGWLALLLVMIRL